MSSGLTAASWWRAPSTPVQRSDEQVGLVDAAQLISESNPTLTPERLLARLMETYWTGALSLFSLDRPSEQVWYPGPSGEPRSFDRFEGDGQLVQRIDGNHEDGPRVPVNDREQLEWPREKLLDCLKAVRREGYPEKINPSWPATEATWRALAQLSPAAYDPSRLYLGKLWAHRAELARWCGTAGLRAPPMWLPRETTVARAATAQAPVTARRRPAHLTGTIANTPTLTLAEAVTLLAYRRPITKQRLREWMTRCGGRFRPRAKERFERFGKQVARLIYGGVTAYGELYVKRERLGERAEIKDRAFLDLAFADAKRNCLVAYPLDPDDTRAEAGFALHGREYKRVTVDRQEFLAAIHSADVGHRPARATPYWNLAQAGAWIGSRDLAVVAKFDGASGNNVASCILRLDLMIGGLSRVRPVVPDSRGREEALVRALQANEVAARGRRAPNGRPERIPAEDWAHLKLRTGDRDDDGKACDGSGCWIELRFSSAELQRAFPDWQSAPSSEEDLPFGPDDPNPSMDPVEVMQWLYHVGVGIDGDHGFDRRVEARDAALRAGQVKASGIHDGERSRRYVPAMYWQDYTLLEATGDTYRIRRNRDAPRKIRIDIGAPPGPWREIQLHRADVLRVWPPPTQLDNVLAPTTRQRSTAPLQQDTALPPPRSEVVKWYRTRVASWPPDTWHPSREDDERAAAEHFGRSVPREWVRQCRREHAPPEWSRNHPKTGNSKRKATQS